MRNPGIPNPESVPVLVEVWRDGAVESRHRGAVAVVDREGHVVATWGEADRPVFPRSAVKPLQALALVESGAAERFHVTDAELALASASHTGTPEHTRPVAAWLARMGLGEADLECGAHAPNDEVAAEELVRNGLPPSPLHNNCSGKHAGMLATALHLGVPTRGYIDPDHPVQQLVRRILGEMSGLDLDQAPVALDGCSLPTLAMPLTGMALAMARLGAPAGLSEARAEACRRVWRAMAAHPRLVAGPGRFCTDMIETGGGAFVVKVGAEGVYVAAWAERGLGIALKIEDGARRAAEIAMAALLRHLGALGEAQVRIFAPYFERPLFNRAGRRVGEIRAARGWPG